MPKKYTTWTTMTYVEGSGYFLWDVTEYPYDDYLITQDNYFKCHDDSYIFVDFYHLTTIEEARFEMSPYETIVIID